MKKITKEDIRQLEIAVSEMQSKLIQEGKLRKSSRDATPGMSAWPSLNNNNNPYHAYRFGMSMAGSPAPDTHVSKDGPVGGDFVTIAYTDGDEQILNTAAKKMGIKNASMGSSRNSKELNDVHKVSPVAQIKRNKHGI